jgi:hypothetical protein
VVWSPFLMAKEFLANVTEPHVIKQWTMGSPGNKKTDLFHFVQNT